MRTICIVDDDRVYQIATKKILERIDNSIRILVFSDGDEAYRYLSENLHQKEALPDLIFLDINMQHMNAWQFLEAYKQLESLLVREIPIYIISSSLSDSDIIRAKSNRYVTDYCVKPVNISKFAELLETVNR